MSAPESEKVKKAVFVKLAINKGLKVGNAYRFRLFRWQRAAADNTNYHRHSVNARWCPGSPNTPQPAYNNLCWPHYNMQIRDI
jgi:hypothetical protein